jgi:hypothetical protein
MLELRCRLVCIADEFHWITIALLELQLICKPLLELRLNCNALLELLLHYLNYGWIAVELQCITWNEAELRLHYLNYGWSAAKLHWIAMRFCISIQQKFEVLTPCPNSSLQNRVGFFCQMRKRTFFKPKTNIL